MLHFPALITIRAAQGKEKEKKTNATLSNQIRTEQILGDGQEGRVVLDEYKGNIIRNTQGREDRYIWRSYMDVLVPLTKKD